MAKFHQKIKSFSIRYKGQNSNRTQRTNLELANLWLYFLGLRFAVRLYLLRFKWFCWGYKITNLPLKSSHTSHFPCTAGQLLIRPLECTICEIKNQELSNYMFWYSATTMVSVYCPDTSWQQEANFLVVCLELFNKKEKAWLLPPHILPRVVGGATLSSLLLPGIWSNCLLIKNTF